MSSSEVDRKEIIDKINARPTQGNARLTRARIAQVLLSSQEGRAKVSYVTRGKYESQVIYSTNVQLGC